MNKYVLDKRKSIIKLNTDTLDLKYIDTDYDWWAKKIAWRRIGYQRRWGCCKSKERVGCKRIE